MKDELLVRERNTHWLTVSVAMTENAGSRAK